MHESFKVLSVILTVERGIKNLPIFQNGVSLWLQIPSKTGSTIGGLGGTYPPKTYSSTPLPRALLLSTLLHQNITIASRYEFNRYFLLLRF